MKTIIITVGAQGHAQVETTGFAGGECRDASRFVEQALGRATNEVRTADYHQAQEARQSLQEGR
jgi:hypothetical protein